MQLHKQSMIQKRSWPYDAGYPSLFFNLSSSTFVKESISLPSRTTSVEYNATFSNSSIEDAADALPIASSKYAGCRPKSNPPVMESFTNCLKDSHFSTSSLSGSSS